MPTLEFKGKPFVYSHHLSVPFRELILDQKKSFPGGKKASLDDNLIIHGDNLEALKALLPRYAGKVDVIYIDPPYNTGNEGWAYNDAVNSPLMRSWLGKEVARDDLERHDKWLCMMWPRLELLRELLSPTGAIFASIEDTEQAALLEIMREIFGDERLLATLPIVNNLKGRNDKGNFARAHEYVVAFANPQFTLLGLPLTQKQTAAFKHKDERGELYAIRDMRKRGGADTREERPNLFYPVYFNAEGVGASLERTSKSAFKVLPMKSDGSESCWKWGKGKAGANLKVLSMTKGRQDSKGVGYRLYLNPDAQPGGPDVLDDEDAWDEEAEEPIERVAKPKSFWWGPELSTDGAGIRCTAFSARRSMRLKDYQTKALETLSAYLGLLSNNITKFEKTRTTIAALPEEVRATIPTQLDPTVAAWNEARQLGIAASPDDWRAMKDGIGRSIPHVCLRLPTGGGKTLLAAHGLERIAVNYFRQSTGLVLWIVPSEAIYTQTKKQLSDRSHALRQVLDRMSGGRVKILEKMDGFTAHDSEDRLCVLMLMLPSAIRISW